MLQAGLGYHLSNHLFICFPIVEFELKVQHLRIITAKNPDQLMARSVFKAFQGRILDGMPRRKRKTTLDEIWIDLMRCFIIIFQNIGLFKKVATQKKVFIQKNRDVYPPWN